MTPLRIQKALIWWTIGFGVIYFGALAFLLGLLPTPSANTTAAEVAEFYREHGAEVRLGAAIGALTSAFLVPLTVVIVAQLYRHETLRDKKGLPLLATLTGLSGVAMTVIIAIPSNFLGVAASTPDRAPDATAMMHQLGILSFITGDQWVAFFLVGIAATCLISHNVLHSPFPRWYGYICIFTLIGSEPSVLTFVTRTGPFAWNGLIGYWIPMGVFGVWVTCTFVLLFKAINAQMRDELSSPVLETAAV